MNNIEINKESANNTQKTDSLAPETTNMKKKRVVTRTTYALPDKGSSIELHLKIINAYVIATNEGQKAVSYKDFKNLADFFYGYVSSNNKFLEELGLIASSGSHGMYVPTKHGIELMRYKKWGQEDKALDILKELVTASWFWQSARQVLLMREDGANEREVLNKLGADSKADPEKHIAPLKVLVKYLEYVGFIKRDETTNKIKMALELVPQESAATEELLTEEKQIIAPSISEIKEKQPLPPEVSTLTVQQTSAEQIHYREEPGHFTLRVKLDETSILLLEEEIKYIKGKHALLQKSKKTGEEAK